MRICEDDLLTCGADLLVCPVNLVPGVMGAGLAAAFASRWPALVTEHRLLARRGSLATGRVALVHNILSAPKIALFPTKKHWRHASQIDWVFSGLADLACHLKSSGVRSVAVPALGCGLGGLDWNDVRVLVGAFSITVRPVEVLAFPPR